MKCNFQIGQKVVCIADGFVGHQTQQSMEIYGNEIPVKGQIYHIRSLEYLDEIGPADVYVRLVEIINPKINYLDGYTEATFLHTGFVAYEEKETDISIFQQILERENERV